MSGIPMQVVTYSDAVTLRSGIEEMRQAGFYLAACNNGKDGTHTGIFRSYPTDETPDPTVVSPSG